MEKFCSKEDWEAVAKVKRVFEYFSLIPGFRDKFNENPQETLDELGLGVTVRDIAIVNKNPKDIYAIEAVNKGTIAETYVEFMKRKLEYRDQIRDLCKPANEAMQKWRDRQMSRGLIELGGKSSALIYTPLTIELADGCSVGCEFCGLRAGKLKSVFRYTEENAKLFKGVLSKSKEIIGDAAGLGTLYFASEPLDNPDYEKFLDDYYECFGIIPQITTATAAKHIDQLHNLLKKLNEDGRTIYRFSCLSQDIVETIFREFTPEETVLVEFLPQFEEAPSSNLINCGRNGDKNEEYDDTISCVSGFVVNMSRQTVRLTTPVRASVEHPTGEIILAEEHFDDVDDFEKVIKSLIRAHMMNIIKPSSKLRIYPYIKWKKTEDGFEFYRTEDGKVKLSTESSACEPLEQILDILKDKELTRREIVEQFLSDKDGIVVGSEYVFYLINKLWNLGLLEDLSGQV